jgi:outer membrane protein OmpA-like peptidoglycan-associated protein
MRMRVLAILLALTGVAAAGPKPRRVVTDTQIEILSPIRFVGVSAQVTPQSTRILDAIAETLEGNPSIRLMAVVAFGNDSHVAPRVLGELRARALVSELVRRGVSPTRLRAVGRERPDRGTDPGPELLILERAPAP